MNKKLYFKTSFSDYELIQTDDESWAIYSDFYRENSHSLAGAESETRYNFLEGCEVAKRCLEFDNYTILEVGFGIGNGLATTYEFWKQLERRPKHFLFISQEIDHELVDYAFNQGPYAEKLQSLHLNSPMGWTTEIDDCRFEVKVLPGDARQSVLDIKDKSIHAIFQDAYSPGKNPSLWTLEWFEQLHRISAEKAIMATYSASARVRKAMVEGGWHVVDKKGFGNKRSMSIAFNESVDMELNEKILKARIDSLKDSELEKKDC